MQLDMSKSFDKLSWNYMWEVLPAFSFHQDYIRWIMDLISGAFLSIMVNGFPSKPFCPSRGIIQGYPLSPFLFVIITKGLSRILKLHNPAPSSTHQ